MFQAVRWGLLVGPTNRWHIYGSFGHGRFSGRAILGEGAQAFGREPGDRVAVDADWTRADLVVLFDRRRSLFGVGYRHLRYNRPQAVVDFIGHEVKEDGGAPSVEVDQITGGRFLDARLRGDYLLLGVWDRSSFGFPSDDWWSVEFIVFLGAESVDNGTDRFSKAFGGGLEGTIGVQAGWTWFDWLHVNARLGYRGLYAKSSLANESGEERGKTEYSGFLAVDVWHGPFVGLSAAF